MKERPAWERRWWRGKNWWCGEGARQRKGLPEIVESYCSLGVVLIDIEVLHGCRYYKLKHIAVQWAYCALVWPKLPHRVLFGRVGKQDFGILDGNGDRACEPLERKPRLFWALSISGPMSFVHLDERPKLRCIRGFELVDSR